MARQEIEIRLGGLPLLPASARRPGMIRAACLAALAGKRSGELNVVFVSSARMRRLHRDFMNLDSDTDVMAFGYDAVPGMPARFDRPFGDVYVSVGMAKRQAKELGHGALEEVLTLVAHGCLHLMGYEDSTPRRRGRMFRMQERIVGKVFGGRRA